MNRNAGLYFYVLTIFLQNCHGASISYEESNCSCVPTSHSGTYIGNCQIPDTSEKYFCYVQKGNNGRCCEANSDKFTNFCINYSLCQATVYGQNPKPSPYIIAAFL